jgi:ribosomal protein S18 acetylase RimI-like enzyme
VSDWRVAPLGADELASWRPRAVVRRAARERDGFLRSESDATETAESRVGRAITDGQVADGHQVLSLGGDGRSAIAWVMGNPDDPAEALLVDLEEPADLSAEDAADLLHAIELAARARGATRFALAGPAGVAYSMPLDEYRLASTNMVLDLRATGRRSVPAGLVIAPMSTERADAFTRRLIEHYAADTARAGLVSPAAARERSRAQVEALLPQGADTPGHHLVAGSDDEGEFGVLWVAEQPDSQGVRGWVYDVEVGESRRGRGLGRALMIAAEEIIRGLDGYVVGLNVFGFNDVARGLYLSLGYRVAHEMWLREL